MYSMINPTIIAIAVKTTIRISYGVISHHLLSLKRNGGNRLCHMGNTQQKLYFAL